MVVTLMMFVAPQDPVVANHEPETVMEYTVVILQDQNQKTDAAEVVVDEVVHSDVVVDQSRTMPRRRENYVVQRVQEAMIIKHICLYKHITTTTIFSACTLICATCG